jgi:Holliday junction DNA helicase RuvB
LIEGDLIRISVKSTADRLVKYKLTEKGLALVKASYEDIGQQKTVPATDILEAMSLIVGFDDVKQAIAHAVAKGRRTNFLLEGPPACAKSLMLDGIRTAAPAAYIVFGSRTSASGLSDVLFERQPKVLLLDEADKMHNEVYSVCLGLMERGEILETKSQKTRGIILQTMIIAACNTSSRMPKEFISRFALHIHFPAYTRQEFIDVCVGFLSRGEKCPIEIAQMIGVEVFDKQLGDVRRARGVWELMEIPTVDEVKRVIQLMEKYRDGPSGRPKQESTNQNRLC